MTEIIKLDSINSTNTYANHMLAKTPQLPFVVTAREQYAGRGRYGRSFHSPAGSGVYLSYVFSADYDIDTLLKITVVAAAAVHSILRKFCDGLSIKWINDIYKDDRKVAGILTERVDDPSCPGKYYIIIGVGINVIPCEVPSELSDIIGFVGNSSTDASVIDQITELIIDAFDSIFGDPSADEFPLLIEYYRLHCRELPADFGNKLSDQ